MERVSRARLGWVRRAGCLLCFFSLYASVGFGRPDEGSVWFDLVEEGRLSGDAEDISISQHPVEIKEERSALECCKCCFIHHPGSFEKCCNCPGSLLGNNWGVGSNVLGRSHAEQVISGTRESIGRSLHVA